MKPKCMKCDVDGVWHGDICNCPNCGEQIAHAISDEEWEEQLEEIRQYMGRNTHSGRTIVQSLEEDE